jgi:hypothetical protein
MKFFDVLFGKPIASNEAQAEHIGVAAGVPIFGLDGLTSAAYGPEAAMALLIPLGVWGVQHYLLPIFGFILSLLTILYFRPSRRIRTAAARSRWRARIWATMPACSPPLR